MDAGTETNINLNHQIYYHVLGSNQSEDILCWKDPEHPKYSFGASVTEDGKVTCSRSCHLYKDIVINKIRWYLFLENEGIIKLCLHL